VAYLPPRPDVESASYGTVRAAVERARAGAPTQLEGNIGMSATEARSYARSLLQDDPTVSLRVDGIWLFVEPTPRR
jgi:hypothetical protein